MLRVPNYFIAVFGDTHRATYPVEGGVYGHDANYVTSSRITPGDVILLYCCGTYTGHDNEIPGFGILTSIRNNGDGFNYQYLPFCQPINVDWNTMKLNMPELAPPGNRIWHYKGNFLRQISSSSFRATVAGRQVDWP